MNEKGISNSFIFKFNTTSASASSFLSNYITLPNPDYYNQHKYDEYINVLASLTQGRTNIMDCPANFKEGMQLRFTTNMLLISSDTTK